MIVTVNTDASLSPKHKVATFAFWIVCNEGRIMKAGAFKNQVTNPTEAEVKCIVNALQTLFLSGFSGVSKVIINTDCLYFREYVNNKKKNNRPESKELQKVCSRLIKKYNLKRGWIEVRHVKAHSGTDSKRKYVNDWCDKAAKKVLREIINQ